MKKLAGLTAVLAIIACATGAGADPLSNNRHIFFSVTNDSGVKYNFDGATYSGPSNTYYIKADGGGLNAEHITTDATKPSGQITAINSPTSSISGTFYLTDTGGSKYVDDVILMVSLAGPVANNFSLSITTSGYTWAPGSAAPTAYTYVPAAVSETFGKADLIYGPNAYKPGPGTLGTWSLPFYNGQNTSDPSTLQYVMFIDCYVGGLNNTALQNGGAVAVQYSFDNLYGDAAFNMYGWDHFDANSGEGISWTNNTATNSYFIDYTGDPAPVPLPPSLFLLGGGLGSLALSVRRRAKQ